MQPKFWFLKPKLTHINHDKFVSSNNVLKEQIKNPENDVEYTI